MRRAYFRYWGKSTRDNGSFHLLPYHLLDVAAVCHVYLHRHRTLSEAWSRSLGLARPQFESWVTFLAAMHDAGKFTAGFQDLAPDLRERLQGARPGRPYAVNHVVAGALGFREYLRPRLVGRWEDTGSFDPDDIDGLYAWWEGPFVGHHGAPAALGGKSFWTADCWDEHGKDAFLELAEDLLILFDVQSPLPQHLSPAEAERRVRAKSWHLAGLAVLCDWIGSNQAWFRSVDQEMSLQAYWKMALRTADNAVTEARLVPAAHAPAGDTWRMFKAEPRPSQRKAELSRHTREPTLWILEDLTGSGKTEVALLLAHRGMEAGAADGIYFGLPTMATANAMYTRMRSTSAPLFMQAGDVAAALAHSGLRHHPTAPDDGGLQAGPWLAEGPKRALLAQVSVGTLDQALLGVLAVRHQGLRLLALSSKVLIVDEVHAYDPYATELLATLLRFHASAGGSAILLSATMPTTLRNRLATAFQQGLGAPSRKMMESGPYPLLTRIDAAGVEEHPVGVATGTTRRTAVRILEDPREAEAVVRRAHAEGKASCWIRNTVADAAEAYERLGDLEPVLFHARFLPEDRDHIEQRVRVAAGKDSGPEARRGLVVIATQVVEQSLDLDFDELVTDLAPIDLVIQRAGRLRRHARRADGATAARDERGPATLHVLAPPWTDAPTESWFAGSFPRAAFVYPAHDQLWLTLDVLRREAELDLPAKARMLVESVYGGDAEARVPEGLRRVREKVEGAALAQRSHVRARILKLEHGYAEESGDWESDARAATRGGEPTRRLYLARRHDGRLHPLLGDDWDRSHISVRASRLAPNPPHREAKSILPDAGEWHVLAEMSVDGGEWRGSAPTSSGRRMALRYSHTWGLLFRVDEGETDVQPD